MNPLCGIQCITVYYLHKNISLRLTYSTDGSVSRDVHLAGEFLRVGNDRDDSRISNFRQKLGSRPSLAAHVPHRIPGNKRKPRGIGCIEKSRDPGLDLSHSFFNYNLKYSPFGSNFVNKKPSQRLSSTSYINGLNSN